MSGNTFGRCFTLTSFGESHGKAYGGVVDGMPPGLEFDVDFIQSQLDRRRPGQSQVTSQRREADTIEILSGVFEGKTLGTPIGFIIPNQDAKSKDYDALKGVFRPGHGDYVYFKKYGIRDHRGGGRASARETAVRVAAGAMAQLYLKGFGIEIYGYLSQLGSMEIPFESKEAINKNAFFAPNLSVVPSLERLISDIRKKGDSLGGALRVVATGVPVGLGEPVFHRLDAEVAYAMMSIPAVKGVGIGSGFDSVTQRGSEHRDQMTQQGFLSNHAGGILAGISSGQPIEVHLALKPTSSTITPAQTTTESGDETTVVTKGRHDPCVAIRAVPVAEAMLALVLADNLLQVYGNGCKTSLECE